VLNRPHHAAHPPHFVQTLAGIGPKLAETLARLVGAWDGEANVIDLLFHLLVGIIDRRKQPGIALSAEGQVVTLKVRVDRHAKPPRGQALRVALSLFGRDDAIRLLRAG
jgi:ATP-dependent DNA helicase RecG